MKHIVLTVLLGVMFFSGCGHPKKTNIVFSYGMVSAAEEKVLNDLVMEFEDKNPQIDVVLQKLPSNPALQYKYYLESFEQKLHEPPDVLCLDLLLFPQLAAKEGWLSFVEWYFNEKDKFFPGAVKGCTYQHGIYAIPWSVDGGVLYYRKDLLKKHGFASPPKTFDELINQSNAIIHSEKCSGFIWPGKNSEDMVCTFLEFLWGNEGILLAGREVLVNSLWGKESLQMMADLIHKHGISPQSVLTMDNTAAVHSFISGNAIFLRGWSHSGQSMLNNPFLKDKLGIAPMPCFNDKEKQSASCLQAEVLSINKHSKCEKEAWLLVEFLTSEYVQKKRLLSINKTPSRMGLYNDIQLKENMPVISEFYPAFIQFQSRPITPHYSQISLVMQGCIRDVLMQKLTPEKSFEKATEDIAKVFLQQ